MLGASAQRQTYGEVDLVLWNLDALPRPEAAAEKHRRNEELN